MRQVTLKAKSREKTGKEIAKKHRRNGMVPCVVYGRDFDNLHLLVDEIEMKKVLTTGSGTHVIVNLQVEEEKGTKEYTSLVSEIQKDVFQKKYLHIDFRKISLDKKVKALVPVKPIGLAKGVKDGGIMDQLIREVLVEAFPLDLPERIDVDVTAMKENDSITVADLNLSESVKCMLEPTDMVLIVHPPRVAEEESAGAGAESKEAVGATAE